MHYPFDNEHTLLVAMVTTATRDMRRRRCVAYEMWVDGIIILPRDKGIGGASSALPLPTDYSRLEFFINRGLRAGGRVQ